MRHCRCVARVLTGYRGVRLAYESARGAPSVLKKKEPSSLLGRRIRDLRLKRCWTQREAAEKSFVTESAFRSYELGDRMPKREIVDRIAKAFGVRSEYLTAPELLNEYEFCYVILQNEENMRLKPYKDEKCGKYFISCEPNNENLSEFIGDWGEMRDKLKSQEITQEEYEEWKTTWDNGINIMDLRARGEL